MEYPLSLAAIRFLDMATLFIYLASMVGIGVYFARKNKTTSQYFFADSSVPGWAVGLSMVGTSISAVTFVGMPAVAFVQDWRLLLINLGFIPGSLLAIYLLIPFFRRGSVVSTLDYIHYRFGDGPRLFCAISMIGVQLIRLAVVLFLMAIPISYITDIPILWIIIVAGVLTSLYTFLGGIEAVIWTDVIQTFILVGGGILLLALCILGFPEGQGIGDVMRTAAAEGKLSFGEMRWDLSDTTFYTVALAGLMGMLSLFTDPTVIQRWISAESQAQARRATWINLVLCCIIWSFFYFLGTCLFYYYKYNPDSHVQELIAGKQVDSLLPYFITTKVPAGLAGFIVAGVAAAAMSSLSASINICGTLFIGDVVRRHLAKNRSEKFYFRCSQAVTLLVSAIMITGSVIFFFIPKKFMIDLSTVLTVLLTGCLTGLFAAGLFTRSINTVAAMAAIILGTLVNAYAAMCLVGIVPEAYRFGFHEYLLTLFVTMLFLVFAFQIVFFQRRIAWAVAVLVIFNLYAIANTLHWLPGWASATMFNSVGWIIGLNIVLGPLALLASRFREKPRDLTGLTIWTAATAREQAEKQTQLQPEYRCEQEWTKV